MKKQKTIMERLPDSIKDTVIGLKSEYVASARGDDVFVPKTPYDVYQLTLSDIASNDGMEKIAQETKDLMFLAMTQRGDQELLDSLFDAADRYGARNAEKSKVYAGETKEALQTICSAIYEVFIEPKRVNIDDTSYIPRYPLVSNINLDGMDPAIVTYLVGFSFGFTGGSVKSENTLVAPIKIDIPTDLEMLQKRNDILCALRQNPQKIVDLISSISDIESIESIDDIERVEARYSLFLPNYTKYRIAKILAAKKKTPTEREVQDGKIIVRSEWDKRYIDPLLPAAEKISAPLVQTGRAKQLENVLSVIPVLQENILAIDCSGLEIGVLWSTLDDFESLVTGTESVDWRPLRSEFKLWSGTLPTKNQRKVQQEIDAISTIISEGVIEDKTINALRISLANRLGNIALTREILQADFVDEDRSPSEVAELFNTFWIELSVFQELDLLTTEECIELFSQFVEFYANWNLDDSESLNPQAKAVIPVLARAKVRAKTKDERVELNMDIERALDYLQDRQFELGLDLDRVDVLRERFIKNGSLSIAIKTCPSRRPSRLLAEESKADFYYVNPYKSDAVELMLATQEIVWFMEDCGIPVEVNYIVLATDERDYLEPIYSSIYDADGIRPIAIQSRLDQFCLNLNGFAQAALPESKVEVIQIEDLETLIYQEPYPLSYFDRLDEVSQEIIEEENPLLNDALVNTENTYKERFAPSSGLYGSFYRPGLNYKKIALRRAATYSLQMRTILNNYDLLLDTSREPTVDRVIILNREVNKNPERYGPISNLYATFGSRNKLGKKLYEKQ